MDKAFFRKALHSIDGMFVASDQLFSVPIEEVKFVKELAFDCVCETSLTEYVTLRNYTFNGMTYEFIKVEVDWYFGFTLRYEHVYIGIDFDDLRINKLGVIESDPALPTPDNQELAEHLDIYIEDNYSLNDYFTYRVNAKDYNELKADGFFD